MKFDFDIINHETRTFCVLRFFSYSFTASDGSEESTAGRVVAPCSIMVHHGFRSNQARRAIKQKYRLRQTTSHSSLLVARQGDVSRKLNQAFPLVDSFNFNFVDEERSDILCNIYLFNFFNHISKYCFLIAYSHVSIQLFFMYDYLRVSTCFYLYV